MRIGAAGVWATVLVDPAFEGWTGMSGDDIGLAAALRATQRPRAPS